MGRDHGYARYKLDGCRCYVCGWARHVYDTNRERMIREGTWQPYVPAQPVIDHVRALQAAGLGVRTIAALCGTDRKQIRDLSIGRRIDPARGNPWLTKVRREKAQRILAIPADSSLVADGANVDASETHRLIAELVAQPGWTKNRIAREALLRTSGVLYLPTDKVSGRTARLIRDLHAKVFGLEVPSVGPPPADDEVDWVVVERALDGRNVELTEAEKRLVVLGWLARGVSRTAAAKRVHWHVREVDKIHAEEIDSKATG